MASRSRSEAVGWSGLPENIQVHILQLLPPAGLRRARLACKAWAQLVPGPALAAKQHLTLSGPLTDCSAALAAALQRCSGLTSLALLQPVSGADLDSMAVELPRLTSLACCIYNTDVYKPQLATLAAMSHLRSLHITCVDCHNQPGCGPPLSLELSALTSLVSLRLSAILPASLAAATGLTELLVDCGSQSGVLTEQLDLQLTAALPVLTQLRSLQLDPCGVLGWVSPQHLSALTALTRLHLPDNCVSGVWLSGALPRLTELADLRCRYLWQLPPSEQPPAVTMLTAITRLQLAESRLPESLGAWLTSLPRLLDLRLCIASPFISRDELAPLGALTALTALALAVKEPETLRASLAHLGALIQLRRLALEVFSLADTRPPGLPALTALDLSRAGHPAAWLPALATQLPRLRSLAVRTCRRQISSMLPAHLAACIALQEVHLFCDCEDEADPACVDAAGIACLEALPQLPELHLWERHAPPPAPPAPPARAVIQRMAQTHCSLRRLVLHNAQIGEEDFAALASLRSLDRVTFRRYDVRRAPGQLCRPPPRGGRRLAELLGAGCRVVYEDVQPA